MYSSLQARSGRVMESYGELSNVSFSADNNIPFTGPNHDTNDLI